MNKINLVTTNQIVYPLAILIYLALAGCTNSDKSFMQARPEDIAKQRAYKGSIFKELKAAVWEVPIQSYQRISLIKNV